MSRETYIPAARNVTEPRAWLNGMQFVPIVGEAPSLPYSFIVVLREFAQPGSSFLACTARAAGSRPYDGWAIVSVWRAKTLPGTTQESRISHQPGAPLSAGTARQITIYLPVAEIRWE